MSDYIKRLIELRKENEYTQEYVADYLKIDHSIYKKFELGKRKLNLKNLVDLAKLYKVTTNYILCVSDNKNNTKKE